MKMAQSPMKRYSNETKNNKNINSQLKTFNNQPPSSISIIPLWYLSHRLGTGCISILNMIDLRLKKGYDQMLIID